MVEDFLRGESISAFSSKRLSDNFHKFVLIVRICLNEVIGWYSRGWANVRH